MSTIANIELPAEEFALRETLATVPDAEFEIERVVAHDDERVMPFLWASGGDMNDIDATLREDPSVNNLELLSDLGDERLYRMDWTEQIRVVVHLLVEEDATILDAYGAGTKWDLRILFPEREALSATHDFCEDADITMDITSIYEMDQDRHGRFGLSEAQHETLLAAFEHGHYEVPREITLDELAEELDVSHQALSERFRRAYHALIENTLVVGVERENQ